MAQILQSYAPVSAKRVDKFYGEGPFNGTTYPWEQQSPDITTNYSVASLTDTSTSTFLTATNESFRTSTGGALLRTNTQNLFITLEPKAFPSEATSANTIIQIDAVFRKKWIYSNGSTSNANDGTFNEAYGRNRATISINHPVTELSMASRGVTFDNMETWTTFVVDPFLSDSFDYIKQAFAEGVVLELSFGIINTNTAILDVSSISARTITTVADPVIEIPTGTPFSETFESLELGSIWYQDPIAIDEVPGCMVTDDLAHRGSKSITFGTDPLISFYPNSSVIGGHYYEPLDTTFGTYPLTHKVSAWVYCDLGYTTKTSLSYLGTLVNNPNSPNVSLSSVIFWVPPNPYEELYSGLGIGGVGDGTGVFIGEYNHLDDTQPSGSQLTYSRHIMEAPPTTGWYRFEITQTLSGTTFKVRNEDSSFIRTHTVPHPTPFTNSFKVLDVIATAEGSYADDYNIDPPAPEEPEPGIEVQNVRMYPIYR